MHAGCGRVRRATRRLACKGALTLIFFWGLAPLKGVAGSGDWVPRFKAFIKTLNHFLEVWNDGEFDAAQWRKVETAWNELDRK